MKKIEFFYDVSSPWTYLAFTNIQPLAKEEGAEVIYKPFLVGGVFNTINPSVYQQRENPVPAKAAYALKDMQDWAELAGITIKFPPSVFPVNSVKGLRALLWAEEQGGQIALAKALFELYWGEDRDISQDDVLAEAAVRAGLDAARLAQAVNDPAIKAQLKANTDEVIARGGFGSRSIGISA